MALWYKEGVFGELTHEAAMGLRKVKGLYASRGKDVFITCVREGTHCATSYHPLGDAWDMRKDGMPIGDIKNLLGEDFDVVDEKTHLHIELDPKN